MQLSVDFSKRPETYVIVELTHTDTQDIWVTHYVNCQLLNK